jgi:hypothetical protein
MRRSRTPWHESSNPTTVVRGATWRGWIWVITAVVMVGLIVSGIWWFRVATSEIRGAGDATIQINSGQNQIQSQALFEEMYAKILEYDKNLDVAAAALAKSPSSFNQTNYDGLVMTCNTAVTEYDAETRKVGSAKWRSSDLPYKIDTTAPETDCREANYQETPR